MRRWRDRRRLGTRVKQERQRRRQQAAGTPGSCSSGPHHRGGASHHGQRLRVCGAPVLVVLLDVKAVGLHLDVGVLGQVDLAPVVVVEHKGLDRVTDLEGEERNAGKEWRGIKGSAEERKRGEGADEARQHFFAQLG